MVTDSYEQFMGYTFSKGQTCDYIPADSKSDCGEPATYIIMAAPPRAEEKPFYACEAHRHDVDRDLRDLGWNVRPVQPL